MTETTPSTAPMRVLLVGATGTAGQGTARGLLAAGHDVTCVVRSQTARDVFPRMVRIEVADVTDPTAMAHVLTRGRFDAVVSCLASRTGAPSDAWAIDHDAQVVALEAAQAAGISRFVLLSAICVQKPMLEFQRAKLAFEERLMASGADLFHRAADGVFQIPLGSDRAGAGGQTVPAVRGWQPDGVQTDQR
jgi:divinyl chlorophyllide a 8-vinyl-reductase